MSDTDREEAAVLVDRLQTALGESLRGSLVMKWVALVEIIDEDGARAVWCLTPPDTKVWDSLGLLQFGIQKEQAGMITDLDDE